MFEILMTTKIDVYFSSYFYKEPSREIDSHGAESLPSSRFFSKCRSVGRSPLVYKSRSGPL